MKQFTMNVSTAVILFLLLISTTLLIGSWTVNVAGNRDVIDFVSFAGTVIGIILALLAIIYSYYTTASQATDTGLLRSEIGKLGDTVREVKVYSDRLSDQLMKLQEIKDDMADIKSSMNDSKEKIDELKENIAAKMLATDVATRIAERTEPKPARTANENDEADDEIVDEDDDDDDENALFIPALNSLAANALASQVIDYYIAVSQLQRGFSASDTILREVYGETAEVPHRVNTVERTAAVAFTLMDLGVNRDQPNMNEFKKFLLARCTVLTDAIRVTGQFNPPEISVIKKNLEAELGNVP